MMMKKFFRIKSIRFKKPDMSGVRKEWSWESLRRLFCYRPMLWLGLPVVAILSFAIAYVICLLAEFDLSPLRQGVAIMATSSFGYVLGMFSLVSLHQEDKEMEEAGVKQTLLQKILTYGIFITACVVLVWMEADEIIEDRGKWMHTIGTVIAIIATLLPGILSKLIYR